MRIALLLLFLALLTTGCRKAATHTTAVATAPDTLVTGTFITTTGEYHGREGKYTRTVKLTSRGNSIDWHITNVKGNSGESRNSKSSISALVLSKPADPWFIYVESPARLWLCDGHANLYACFISDSGSNDHDQLVNSGHRTTKEMPLPAEVYQRLPESLRALFPAPEKPENRPAF